MNVPEILATLEHYSGVYEREAVEAAISHRDEIIPHLMAILERVAADPERVLADANYYGHVYAALLLGHFELTAAHAIVIDLLKLPEATLDELYDDLITEYFAVILVRTCGGSVKQIKALAENAEVDAVARVTALYAVTYAVLKGFILREAALSWFEHLLKAANPETLTEDDCYFYESVANVMVDLYPEEVMDTVHWAFEQEILEDGLMIGMADFNSALKAGKEACLKRLRESYERRSLDDIHSNMDWWACFQPEKPIPEPPLPRQQSSVPARGFNPVFVEPKKKKKKNFWDL